MHSHNNLFLLFLRCGSVCPFAMHRMLLFFKWLTRIHCVCVCVFGRGVRMCVSVNFSEKAPEVACVCFHMKGAGPVYSLSLSLFLSLPLSLTTPIPLSLPVPHSLSLPLSLPSSGSGNQTHERTAPGSPCLHC